jgi:PDZ domain-containing protein
LIALGALVGVLWIIPSDHYLYLPDPALEVDPLVSVPDENEDESPAKGGIYMVDIIVRRAQLFERLFPEIHAGAELVPEHVVNPAGVSESERRQESLSEMSASQQVAIAVALRSLGHDVDPRGAEVARVLPDAPAEGKLEVGDVIVEASGKKVSSPTELFDVMRSHRPGTPVRLEIRRDGRLREIVVGTRSAGGGEKRAIVGIIVQPEFRFPVGVNIDAGRIGGPSAGLAFALDIVDELGRDLDRGRRIVVTGTLSLDGTVGEIGGIEQKVVGARLVDADIFIVPVDNEAEARRHAEGLEIVAVEDFEDALSALATG